MELINYKGYLITYFRQGNDKNGNSIYCMQLFFQGGENYINITHKLAKLCNKKTDKFGNFKTQKLKSNIANTVKWYIDEYENIEN